MGKRKFTESRDGILRSDVKAATRLTEEELETLKKIAKEEGTNFSKFLSYLFSEGIFNKIERWQKDQEEKQ